MRKWPLTKITILGVGLILITALAYFGPQIRTYYTYYRYTPFLWMRRAPRTLDETVISRAPGMTLSYFGYKFEVPWVDIVKEWRDTDGRRARILFSTGQEVSFFDPAISQRDPLVAERISGSKYDHLEAVLSSTVPGFSPFLSHQSFARQEDRVLTKGNMLEHSGATDIFRIQGLGYKGFEVSGISYNGRVDIALFDAADHQFLIGIRQMPGPPIKTTQLDINRVIQSFGPTGQERWIQDSSSLQAIFGMY